MTKSDGDLPYGISYVASAFHVFSIDLKVIELMNYFHVFLKSVR